MAKSLLERLSHERPRNRKKNLTLSSIREFIKRHKSEIEEAKAHGYSWLQIEKAIRELYGNNDFLAGIHWWKTRRTLIEYVYRAMKRAELLASK